MLKWILIVWIVTAEMPLGGPLTYGTWHESYEDCHKFAVDNKYIVLQKLTTQFGVGGFGFDDIDCMDTFWYKSNIIDSGFDIDEITGIPEPSPASQ